VILETGDLSIRNLFESRIIFSEKNNEELIFNDISEMIINAVWSESVISGQKRNRLKYLGAV
jgi:hypothetical protein